LDEEISAWEKRAEEILGAFERRWAIPKRMRYARRRWRRHSQSRWHQLCMGRRSRRVRGGTDLLPPLIMHSIMTQPGIMTLNLWLLGVIMVLLGVILHYEGQILAFSS